MLAMLVGGFGLLYMNLLGYTNVVRNVTLAVLIIPIAFVANVICVMILILVTYHRQAAGPVHPRMPAPNSVTPAEAGVQG